MRNHGWQLPYHPLQVVAIAVFLALGFAFYVFFLPFVGSRVFQYIVLGLYTPLVACVFCLYVWCAATDPADRGVFKSKKYLNIKGSGKLNDTKSFKQGSLADNHTDSKKLSEQLQKEESNSCSTNLVMILFGWCPLSFVSCCYNADEHASEQQGSEDGMFYCSLCEVEVLKYSKHCRVCDKCVDSFDHHCRWLNNCIGKRNYGRFFILMISAILMLILQWSIGILVLILCFLERKRFNTEISAKLGSSFSLVPYIIVVASCTFLAMLATLPLAQLFFFHVLLIKKGLSTYDYIVALREQEQEQEQEQLGVGQQSPQMSSVSSFTAISSASSFNQFRRDAWCTPPRLFLEDQFDVIPPEVGNMSMKLPQKKAIPDQTSRKKPSGEVKISPWALARLNAEEVSKAAAQAKKRSKILQPVKRQETTLQQQHQQGHETDSSSFCSIPSIDHSKRLALNSQVGSTSLAPLQLAARSAFRTSRAMSSNGISAASPDSSLESPDLNNPFRVSSYRAEDSHGLMPLPENNGIQLLRSMSSDGYEASGGEDSDGLPSRIVHRSVNWNNVRFISGRGGVDELKASSSMN